MGKKRHSGKAQQARAKRLGKPAKAAASASGSGAPEPEGATGTPGAGRGAGSPLPDEPAALVFYEEFHPYREDAAAGKARRDARTREQGTGERAGKRRNPRRIAVIAAASLCCVLLAGFGAVALALNLGKQGLVQEAQIEPGSQAASADDGKTIVCDGRTYRQKEDMTSILLLGHDGRTTAELNGQTDFVMLLAVDTTSGQMDLVSIPRDTMVQVRTTFSNTDEYAELKDMQVAAAFAYGSDLDHSALNACDAVSRMLYNVPINYYYVLNVEGIGSLADAVGGVTVEALMDVKPAGIVAGRTYTLTGEQAYYYLRYRDIKEHGSAFGRLERQKQFMKAFAARALEEAKGNPAAILGIVDAVASYSTTNIGAPEMAFLAQVFLEHGMGELTMTTLEGEYVHNDETGYAEYHLDRDAAFRTILGIYYEPVEDYEAAQAAEEERKDIATVTDAEE